MDVVKCPLCGKQVMTVQYGGGRIASCCDRLVYNEKLLSNEWETFDCTGRPNPVPGEAIHIRRT